jgi:hypothetical protein
VSKQEADNSNPQVGSDGFTSTDFSKYVDNPVDRVCEPPQAQQAASTATPVKGNSAPRSSVPVTLSMDGAVGLNAVGDAGKSEKIGLSAFTNGLGSPQIVGLSGRVLAGANPFSSQE